MRDVVHVNGSCLFLVKCDTLNSDLKVLLDRCPLINQLIVVVTWQLFESVNAIFLVRLVLLGQHYLIKGKFFLTLNFKYWLETGAGKHFLAPRAWVLTVVI